MKSSFDMTPEDALKAISNHQELMLVDLDETLYLRNSTEDFIDTACPSWLAFALLKLLELLHPWRWTGGEVTRDAWRVRLICLFFPWTILLWKRRVSLLASRWANQALLHSLNENYSSTNTPPIIVTLGFMQVVKPLISKLNLPDVEILAMSPWRLKGRRQGKLIAVTNAIGIDQVKKSLLVTDSLDDQDILEQCKLPLRVIWPAAHFAEAFNSKYLPGQYLAKIKRPGQQYIYRVILREDFVFWVLSSIQMAFYPITHIFGLAFLLLSFWTIYEWGYMDNDRIGAQYEKKPNLSKEYSTNQVKFSTPWAWAWSAASGIIGLLIVRWPERPTIEDLFAWTCVLLVTYYCFFLYNRLNKLSRIWLYAALRFLRIAAFAVIVPIPVVGAAAICAYTLSRWVPYMHYRVAGNNWNEEGIHITWLLFFSIICVMFGHVLGWNILFTPTTFGLLCWYIVKARHELYDIFSAAHRIDHQDNLKKHHAHDDNDHSF